MKAQYISTPGRAKKIIATVWMAAISLNCVIVPFVSGVSIKWYERVIHIYVPLKLIECLYQCNSTEMYTLVNLMN